MKITPKFQGYRLDMYLAEKLEISRNQAQKIALANRVFINDKLATKHQFLKIGDIIEIREETEEIQKEKNNPVKTKLAVDIRSIVKDKPKVLVKNKNYLVIEKPVHMLVHATTRGETDTLVDWLLKKYPKLKKVGSDDPVRPAIVHRLDKEVSGIMLVPRTLDAFDCFKKQFQLRTIKKEYIALVHGVIQNDHDEITFPITRSKSGKYVAMPVGAEGGKASITEFEVLQKFIHYTLVRILPHTGRTNQIRIHMAAYGNPIVGDTLYISKKINPKHKTLLDRVFLHAQKITFVDTDGETQTVESPMPESLSKLTDKLK